MAAGVKDRKKAKVDAPHHDVLISEPMATGRGKKSGPEERFSMQILPHHPRMHEPQEKRHGEEDRRAWNHLMKEKDRMEERNRQQERQKERQEKSHEMRHEEEDRKEEIELMEGLQALMNQGGNRGKQKPKINKTF